MRITIIIVVAKGESGKEEERKQEREQERARERDDVQSRLHQSSYSNDFDHYRKCIFVYIST